MKLKESLKSFLKPQWEKIILVFILEFSLTFILLTFEAEIPDWLIYILSPNSLYLESVVNPFTVTRIQLAFHGALSNLMVLVYYYFLSCLIIMLRKNIVIETGKQK